MRNEKELEMIYEGLKFPEGVDSRNYGNVGEKIITVLENFLELNIKTIVYEISQNPSEPILQDNGEEYEDNIGDNWEQELKFLRGVCELAIACGGEEAINPVKEYL